MAKFVTGEELEKVVYDIIWDAESILLMVSPYIRLDKYFMSLFDKHANNPRIHIIIVFGKNENAVSRSLSKEDFEYFKKFLNVSIIYVPNLHGKYYGNEKKGIITSINLYDYSFKSNIEFGVYSEGNLVDRITNSPDQDAWKICRTLADENEAVFIKRPVFEKKILSVLLGKNYVKSDVLHDVTEKFYYNMRSRQKDERSMRMSDFPEELELGSTPSSRPSREEIENPLTAYCIRTGKKIPFSLERPMTIDAFREWSKKSDRNQPENYCHFSGEPSNGKTSMAKPILLKNWKKAQEKFNIK